MFIVSFDSIIALLLFNGDLFNKSKINIILLKPSILLFLISLFSQKKSKKILKIFSSLFSSISDIMILKIISIMHFSSNSSSIYIGIKYREKINLYFVKFSKNLKKYSIKLYLKIFLHISLSFVIK